MQFFSKNLKVILAVAIVIAIGFAAFMYLNKDEEPVDSGSGLASEDAIQSEIGKQIFTTLALLDTIKLDRTFLTGPVFASLRDFTTEISPEPVGRENPFLPLRVAAPAPGTRR